MAVTGAECSPLWQFSYPSVLQQIVFAGGRLLTWALQTAPLVFTPVLAGRPLSCVQWHQMSQLPLEQTHMMVRGENIWLPSFPRQMLLHSLLLWSPKPYMTLQMCWDRWHPRLEDVQSSMALESYHLASCFLKNVFL